MEYDISDCSISEEGYMKSVWVMRRHFNLRKQLLLSEQKQVISYASLMFVTSEKRCFYQSRALKSFYFHQTILMQYLKMHNR